MTWVGALLCALAQDPTADEQLLIYEINRARSNPQAYAAEHGLGPLLDGVAPSPPLAVNMSLQGSSGFHVWEMATFGYFGHQSPVTGDWPNQMAYDAGYPLPGWPGDQNYIESLAAGYADVNAALEGWIVDAGVSPPGHREHLLATGASESFWLMHREIGAGFYTLPGSPFVRYYAVHTAFENPGDTFLTGVVFNDVNGNGRYDLLEGLAGETVSVGGPAAVTNAAGGWAILVGPGTYLVTAFGGASAVTVDVGGSSVEVDFISGKAVGDVGFGASWGAGGGGAGGQFSNAGGGGGGAGILGDCSASARSEGSPLAAAVVLAFLFAALSRVK